jgi:NAD(P)H-hydrate epimerase
VRLLITGQPERMSPDMLANFRIVEAMGLEHVIATDGEAQCDFIRSVRSDEVVLDALLGTGFRGEVRSPTAELIEVINLEAKRGTVAIDIPSGLDCDTGEPSNATIRADLTITFVARKTGLMAPQAASYVGKIEVADIGVPCELVTEISSGSVD